MDIEKYIELFSKERINSYESIERHNENLRFIQEISIILGLIELIMRNKIDKLMIEKMGNNWIFDLIKEFKPRLEDPDNKLKPIEKRLFENIINIINKFGKENQILQHSQLISRLNFGFWVDMVFYIIDYRKFDYQIILDSAKINTIHYSSKNKIINNEKIKIQLIFKTIQKIRNRAFHWKNLFKKSPKKGKEISNIYTRIKTEHYEVVSDKIKKFLNDVLYISDEELVKEIINPPVQ